MADKAGSALSRLLQRLPFKMPWQVRRMVMLLLHDGLSERERYKMSVRERREQDEPKKRPPRRNSFSTSASLFSLPLSFVPCWRFLDTLSSLPPFSTPQSSQKNATNTHGHPPTPKKNETRQVTGVASSPEFASYIPPATEYRKHAPGSQPIKAVVPHARPERIYDIKYWPRDARRAGQVVGGTNKRHVEESRYDVTAADEKFDAAPVFAVGKPHRWGKKVPLLDYPNNGYTT